jgi:hypothetical protein
MTVVGWFAVAPGSWGRIGVSDLGPDRDASVTACPPGGEPIELLPAVLGLARVDGALTGLLGSR